jgi:hypothetical protein
VEQRRHHRSHRRRGEDARGSPCCHHDSTGKNACMAETAAATTAALVGVVVDGFHSVNGEVHADLLLLLDTVRRWIHDRPRESMRALPPAEIGMGDLPGGTLGGQREGAPNGSRGGRPVTYGRQWCGPWQRNISLGYQTLNS